MTARRCTSGLKKKLDLQSGSQRHICFVGFFNILFQASKQGQPFHGHSEKCPISVAFYEAHGVRRTCSRLKPPGSPQGIGDELATQSAMTIYKYICSFCKTLALFTIWTCVRRGFLIPAALSMRTITNLQGVVGSDVPINRDNRLIGDYVQNFRLSIPIFIID